MGSVFDQVVKRVNEQRELETMDIPVPDVPGLFVRCARILDPEELADVSKRYSRVVDANAWMIARTCVGIFVEDNGAKIGFSPDKPMDPKMWPRFDKRLDPMLPNLPDDATSMDRVKALLGAGVHPDSRAGAVAVAAGVLSMRIAELHHTAPKAG